MADYRLAVSIVSRSTGRSSTAAAAYRAGQRIYDERTGELHDYTRKGGVEWTGIEAPKGTPDWVQDRNKLWNAVEASETRKNSQTAREIQLSLPHELTFEQRKALVLEFVRTELVAKGMVADVAMHQPDRRGDERNFHAHILVTTREIGPEGFGAKNREWNSKETLQGLRERWAEIQNHHLREHLGPNAPQVDHRSYDEQGIEKMPGRHLGPDASAMERRGAQSDKGDYNRAVSDRNEKIRRSRQRQAEIAAQVEQRRPFDLALVRLNADIKVDEAVLVVSKASAQLRRVQDQQKTVGWVTKRGVKLEVLDGRHTALRKAKREQGSARWALNAHEWRMREINGRAANLKGWIKNPRRMLWLKLAEIRASDKLRDELNRHSKDVLRLTNEVKVREAWLASTDGRAWAAERLRPRRELRTEERRLRREIARAGRAERDARTLSATVYALERLPAKQINPLVAHLSLAAKPLDAALAFKEMSLNVQRVVQQLPEPVHKSVMQTVSRNLTQVHSISR
jgi:hypothetical protein